MTLLRDIQQASIDANVDIAVVLRKCKVLASRLGHREFKQWAENELNGYPETAELPSYRTLEASSYGHFTGPFGSGLQNVPIPLGAIPKKYRKLIDTVYFRDAISYYSHLLKSNENSPGMLQAPWAPDLIAKVGTQIYQNMSCLGAWIQISPGTVAALIDTVRNRILSFVLQIEEEVPEAGESEFNAISVPDERITQIFQTHIYGNVSNLAAGSQVVDQTIIENIAMGDFGSVCKVLASNGVSDSDITDLEEALKADRSEGIDKKIGKHTDNWIQKMTSKASSGLWRVGSSVAGNILTSAISKYLGLPMN